MEPDNTNWCIGDGWPVDDDDCGCNKKIADGIKWYGTDPNSWDTDDIEWVDCDEEFEDDDDCGCGGRIADGLHWNPRSHHGEDDW